MRPARRVPADLNRVVAWRSGLRNEDLPADLAGGGGTEREYLHLAVKLDLTHLVGGHVVGSHEDAATRGHCRRTDRQGRPLRGDRGTNTESQEQDKDDDSGGRGHDRTAARFRSERAG